MPLPTTVSQENIETKTQTNFYINHHFVFSKIYSIHFPFWRRYTFLSHLTTKSKISVRWKKTGRRYGRRLFNYKIVLHIIVYVFILQAAECNHAATNSVILYKIKTHTYVLIHLVIFTSYKIYAIYKSTHHSASPKT